MFLHNKSTISANHYKLVCYIMEILYSLSIEVFMEKYKLRNTILNFLSLKANSVMGPNMSQLLKDKCGTKNCFSWSSACIYLCIL